MGWVIFIGSLLVAGLQVFAYYDDLPATLATHFALGGEANGWMSREVFVAFYFGILLFMLGVFIGIGSWIERLGPRYINIPNKAYWLSPERRAESCRALRNWMYALGGINAAFIIAMHQMLIDLNLAKEAPVLNETAFFWGLGAFIAVMAVFTIGLFRRFRKPDEAA